jgi:hypothetical protein
MDCRVKPGNDVLISFAPTRLAKTAFERTLRVIASNAKQSIARHGKKVWIASSLTLLAMTASRDWLASTRSP